MRRPLDIEIRIGEDYVQRQSIELDNAGHETLSPYDTPRHARVWYDDGHRRLHVEFKYLTPDEPKEQFTVNRIVLNVGKMSKKFYSLTVSNVDPRANDMKAAFDEIIQVFQSRKDQYDVRQVKERMPHWNFSLARDFLASKEADLLELAF